MIHLNLDKNKKYLLACSFGPDSMALFYLLNLGGYDFEVAIVNYHLRKESNSEVEGLKDYCNLYQKKLHVFEVEKVITHNIENECRKIRYNYFKELVDQYHYDAVLVAHHEDDLIETYLMQKYRQNLPQFYGIKEKTMIFGVKVIRPLLSETKKELIEICDKNNVPYSIDSTNSEITYLRNKIRHEIIAKLSIEKRLELLTEIRRKNQELESIFDVISHSDLHDKKTLIYFDEITYLYAINMMVKEVNSEVSISKKLAIELLKILNSNKPNIRVPIPHKLYFVKEYERVYFEASNANFNYSYLIEKPMELDTPYFYLDFRKDASNRNVHNDDYPLTIRPFKKGDTTIIKDYKVDVSRLYIDWKMPLSIRKKWPLIINKDGNIIYVPRYQKEFKFDKSINFYVKI